MAGLGEADQGEVRFLARFQSTHPRRNAQGALVQGVLEAPDSDVVASQLFSTGVTPVEIAECAVRVALAC